MRVQLMTEYRLACLLGSRITGKPETEIRLSLLSHEG
jgi:hypothetical protein